MYTFNTIDVDVRDVPDPKLIAAIGRTVHSAFSHLVGAWQVRVSASDGRGHWKLHVRGGFGRHIAWFWAPSDGLVEAVERRLRTFLLGVVVPLVARRAPAASPHLVASLRVPRQLTGRERIHLLLIGPGDRAAPPLNAR